MKPKALEKRIYFHPERCMLCLSCVLACQVSTQGGTLNGSIRNGPKTDAKIYVREAGGTPWLWRCRQCLSAPCVDACFTGGLQKSDTGAVQQNSERCVACGSCYLSCPLEGIHLSGRDQPPQKCDLCGDLEKPLCVQACPSKALEFTNASKFSRIKQRNYVNKLKKG